MRNRVTFLIDGFNSTPFAGRHRPQESAPNLRGSSGMVPETGVPLIAGVPLSKDPNGPSRQVFSHLSCSHLNHNSSFLLG